MAWALPIPIWTSWEQIPIMKWTRYDKDFLGYPDRPTNPDEFFIIRDSLKYHPVVQRHIKSEFKRLNPINLKRDRIFR
jgi:hypothetical protein